MASNLDSYITGVTSGSVPKFPHWAVLVDEEHTCVVDEIGGSARAVTKPGLDYIWFTTDDELKEWIRLNSKVTFKAIQVCPFEVNVEITLIKGNN